MVTSSLVSIIIRTKDRPQLLKRAIQSIATQIYRPLEVVLVNDGGCDISLEELKEFLGEIPLNYIKLDKNVGRAKAGNIGIENSKGEYVGFLDDDDEYLPDHIEKLFYAITNNRTDIVYSGCKMIKSVFSYEKAIYHDISLEMTFNYDFSYSRLLLENYIPFISLLFKKDVLTSIGGFDEDFDLYEDWDLLIRAAEKYNFYHIGDITCIYRIWDENQQLTLKSRKSGADRDAYFKLLNKHFDKITPQVLYEYFTLSWLREWKKSLFEKEISRVKEKEKMINFYKNKNKELMYELQKANTTLSEIYSSVGWKILSKYRKLKERLLPPSSLRGMIYASLLKSIKVLINEGLGALFGRISIRIRRKFYSIRYKARSYTTNNGLVRLSTLQSNNRKPVDIIIPVYNGLSDLKRCIESIFYHTDLDFHSLIIFDDKSEDSNVRDYLQKLSSKNGNIRVYFNDTNIGFVKTINKGLKLSNNDVIILNSDTIVTRGWVEKLQRAAYSRPRVATVTPLSNHAYLCSIPKPLEYNFIPKGYDIDSFAEFIENISLKHYPEIPFGSGFCMYIRREAIKEVGLFNEEVFQKGYGEETDFCLRAYKAGYRNLLDDTTYIYHKGGVSFEENRSRAEIEIKNKMIAENLIKLKTLHPEYEELKRKALSEDLRTVVDYINFRLGH